MTKFLCVALLLGLTGCSSIFDYASEDADGSSTAASFVKLSAPGQAGFMAGAEAATEAVRAATVQRDQAASGLEAAQQEEQSVDRQIATVVSYTDTINKLDAAIASGVIVDPDKSNIQNTVRLARTARLAMQDADGKRNLQSVETFRTEMNGYVVTLRSFVDKYNL